MGTSVEPQLPHRTFGSTGLGLYANALVGHPETQPLPMSFKIESRSARTPLKVRYDRAITVPAGLSGYQNKYLASNSISNGMTFASQTGVPPPKSVNLAGALSAGGPTNLAQTQSSTSVHARRGNLDFLTHNNQIIPQTLGTSSERPMSASAKNLSAPTIGYAVTTVQQVPSSFEVGAISPMSSGVSSQRCSLVQARNLPDRASSVFVPEEHKQWSSVRHSVWEHTATHNNPSYDKRLPSFCYRSTPVFDSATLSPAINPLYQCPGSTSRLTTSQPSLNSSILSHNPFGPPASPQTNRVMSPQLSIAEEPTTVYANVARRPGSLGTTTASPQSARANSAVTIDHPDLKIAASVPGLFAEEISCPVSHATHVSLERFRNAITPAVKTRRLTERAVSSGWRLPPDTIYKDQRLAATLARAAYSATLPQCVAGQSVLANIKSSGRLSPTSGFSPSVQHLAEPKQANKPGWSNSPTISKDLLESPNTFAFRTQQSRLIQPNPLIQHNDTVLHSPNTRVSPCETDCSAPTPVQHKRPLSSRESISFESQGVMTHVQPHFEEKTAKAPRSMSVCTAFSTRYTHESLREPTWSSLDIYRPSSKSDKCSIEMHNNSPSRHSTRVPATAPEIVFPEPVSSAGKSKQFGSPLSLQESLTAPVVPDYRGYTTSDDSFTASYSSDTLHAGISSPFRKSSETMTMNSGETLPSGSTSAVQRRLPRANLSAGSLLEPIQERKLRPKRLKPRKHVAPHDGSAEISSKISVRNEALFAYHGQLPPVSKVLLDSSITDSQLKPKTSLRVDDAKALPAQLGLQKFTSTSGECAGPTTDRPRTLDQLENRSKNFNSPLSARFRTTHTRRHGLQNFGVASDLSNGPVVKTPPSSVLRGGRKGLRNTAGAYNCYLNVVLQSLWYLISFRDAIMALPVQQRGPLARALIDLFEQFSDENTTEALEPGFVKEALQHSSSASRWGKGFVAGYMEDAQEVFEAILDALHSEWVVTTQNLKTSFPEVPPFECGTALRRKDIGCPAHRVFGTAYNDLQLCEVCVAMQRRAEAGFSEESFDGLPRTVLVQRLYVVDILDILRATSRPSEASFSNPPSGATGRPSMVPTDVPVESTLEALWDRELQESHPVPKDTPGEKFPSCRLCGAHDVSVKWRRFLVRAAAAFVCTLIWPSATASKDKIEGMLLHFVKDINITATRVGDRNLGSKKSSARYLHRYTLKALVCFTSKHYVVFLRDSSNWTCCDDAVVSDVTGGLDAVIASCVAKRMLPSMFFYEDSFS